MRVLTQPMTREMKHILWSVLLLAGCGEQSAPNTAARGPWLGLGPALKDGGQAEAWRITGGGPPTPEEARRGARDESLSGDYLSYREIAGPVPLSRSLQNDLTRILSDSTLINDGVHPCIPTPGVKVRYTRAKGVPISICFCFECNELFVYEGTIRREHKGFDPGASALSKVFKKVFPKDPIIQALK